MIWGYGVCIIGGTMDALELQFVHWVYNAFRRYNVCIRGKLCALEVQFVHCGIRGYNV